MSRSLIGYTIREKLELIIALGAITVVTSPHKISHEISSLPLTLVEHKTLLEMLHCLGFEAWQTAVKHGKDNLCKMFAVHAGSQESLDTHLLEPVVGLRICAAAHDCHHLGRELERSSFKPDTTRCDVEAESEVDMQDVSSIVDHDVSVMPVLELQ